MIWEKRDIEPKDVKALADRYGIDSLLASILVRRGILEPTNIKFYLESDIRYLHNPFLFNEMEDVIDRIIMAKEEGEKVLVFGDKDVDGVTSSVILYENLKNLELDLSIKVPKGDDSYGLSVKVVEEAYNNDVSLVLTVDCGISAFDSINRAKELGIDVIVLDHHNPRSGDLPGATFIIDPKLSNSGYPFDGLAAVGVVSKVIWALCFSSIDSLYKSTLCFLHGEVINESVVFSVIKLHNLAEVARYTFKFSKDESDNQDDLLNVIRGEQILVYDNNEQKGHFKEVFGNSLELQAVDIKPELERVLNSINGYPLEILLKHSKMRLYCNKDFEIIDLIINLFITYVNKKYEDKFIPFIKSLDLVALGTIADLMPLEGENRILVKKGLEVLSRTDRNGLHALMFKLNMVGKDISSKDISWGLAPIINSAGRMKRADVAVEFLLGEDPDLRNKNTLTILELNKERRNISDSIWSNLYNEFYKSKEEFSNKIIVHYDEQIAKGVTGLIASKALSSFNVPAIIIAKENDQLSGSIRSFGNLDINSLFEKLSPILTEWGGHNCAAGFKFKFTDYEKFMAKMKAISKSSFIQNEIKKEDKLIVDAFIPSDYLSPEIIKVYDKFEPYGEGNKHLNFVTKEAKILDINFMGKGEKKHLKLLIEIGKYKWPAIYWNSAERAGRDFTKSDIVNIAYRVERNFYGGSETFQLNILDIIK